MDPATARPRRRRRWLLLAVAGLMVAVPAACGAGLHVRDARRQEVRADVRAFLDYLDASPLVKGMSYEQTRSDDVVVRHFDAYQGEFTPAGTVVSTGIEQTLVEAAALEVGWSASCESRPGHVVVEFEERPGVVSRDPGTSLRYCRLTEGGDHRGVVVLNAYAGSRTAVFTVGREAARCWPTHVSSRAGAPSSCPSSG